MKSGLRKLRNAVTGSKPPVPYSMAINGRANIFNLLGGPGNYATYLKQYKLNGTVFSIVSLLQGSAAAPTWHLYKSQAQDGRVRYTTSDRGSDQRVEIIKHAAIQLWNKPNAFMSGFEFREGSNQHEELCGETYWVVDREVANFPTSLWYVTPNRMEPVRDPDRYLLGWIYTGPSGEQVPLELDDVIQEKLPDPEDPYRGCGPVAPIMANIQQLRFATEYQRNIFINGAFTSGVIEIPISMQDREFKQLLARWRESHQGWTRAGRVGVLEAGAKYTPAQITNRDLEYGNLRLASRDEIREAWRVHKAMLGTADDVNRANAKTAKETFDNDLVTPRLDRRRDTLNFKFLPLFGKTGENVEFDYEPPQQIDRELDSSELNTKADAAQRLIYAGFDPEDVCETVGLPLMKFIGATGFGVSSGGPEDTSGKKLPSPNYSPTAEQGVEAEDTGGKGSAGVVRKRAGIEPDIANDVGYYLKNLIGINGYQYVGGSDNE